MTNLISTPSGWQKRLLFAALCILLVLPALQAKFSLVKLTELGGYSEPAPEATFSPEGLLDNSFQTALEKYLEDRIGFRQWMIRLRNQLAYSVFNLGRANNTVVGQDNILFDGNAIDTYLGKNFVGETEIDQNVKHLKDVQDTLASHGTLLIFAIAPGKADVYRDSWPAYYRNLPQSRSNYTAYVEKMTAAKINLIDFGSIFRQWKDTSAYPVFPRGGIHWSLWGRDLAADTLFRYIRQRGYPNIPNFHIVTREFSTEPRDTDNDIAKALNLIKEPAASLMAYPQIKFDSLKSTQRKPNILLVGDSFGFGLIPYMSIISGPESRFWYYNNEIVWAATGNFSEDKKVANLDTRVQLKGRDVVLILFTEPNLNSFDHGFSNSLYQTYHPYTDADYAHVKAIEQQMQHDTTIANRIWRQSYKDGIAPEFIYYREARAIYDLQR